jgi:hypothetical protein
LGTPDLPDAAGPEALDGQLSDAGATNGIAPPTASLSPTDMPPDDVVRMPVGTLRELLAIACLLRRDPTDIQGSRERLGEIEARLRWAIQVGRHSRRGSVERRNAWASVVDAADTLSALVREASPVLPLIRTIAAQLREHRMKAGTRRPGRA